MANKTEDKIAARNSYQKGAQQNDEDSTVHCSDSPGAGFPSQFRFAGYNRQLQCQRSISGFSWRIKDLAQPTPPRCEHLYTSRYADVAFERRLHPPPHDLPETYEPPSWLENCIPSLRFVLTG